MSTHAVRLSVNGARGTIEVDGHHMPGVRSATITTGIDHAPVLELELALGMAEAELLDGAHVEVDDDTRDALEALGWTPPVVDTEP